MATDPASKAPEEPISPIDTSITQAPEATPNTQAPQAHRHSNKPNKYLKIENNVSLGAIQIMTGLVHIGLGALSIDIMIPKSSMPSVTIAGYPFWGGVIFIVSGSLSVAAANYSWNPDLVGISLGWNLASVVVAVIGIILYVFQLVFEGHDNYEYEAHVRVANVFATLLCSILICFSFVEFCLALWAAFIEDSFQVPAPVAAPYTFGMAIVPSESHPPS